VNADWTVASLLRWATDYLEGYQVDAPRLSAELLLAQALGLARLELYLDRDRPLDAGELASFKKLIIRRREHEPLAYIMGEREFYGLPLKVGPGVLIPRPETELLVEEALARLQDTPSARVLDLCTGSGAVALALAQELPQAEVVASDLSEEALAYARQNAQDLGLAERIAWRQGDLWDAVAGGGAGGFFDLITANPPYVALKEQDDLPREVKDYEPTTALLAGVDGMDYIKDIIVGARAFLKSGGWLLVEMGAGQAEAALREARLAEIYQQAETARDLAGHQRVLICRRTDYG
jgi:release factor glutamine methyltransferase